MARQPRNSNRKTYTVVHPTRFKPDGRTNLRKVILEHQLAAHELAGWIQEQVKTEKPVGVETAVETDSSNAELHTDQQGDGAKVSGSGRGRTPRV